MIDLDAIEKLARAATPGPWRAGAFERYHVFVRCEDALGPERVLLRMNTHFPHDADAKLIAAIGPDVALALVTRIRELLAAMVRVTNETPFPDEMKGWTEQRAALVAEVGTLKARVAELERDLARYAKLGHRIEAP